MVNTTAYTIELWMHAGGLQRTQEAQALTFSTSDNSYTSFLLTEEILGDNSCKTINKDKVATKKKCLSQVTK